MSGLRNLLPLMFAALLGAAPGVAQDFNALARLDTSQSVLRDSGAGAEVELHLSQAVPWRIFTIDEPPRIVMDFNEVAWSETPPNTSSLVSDIRVGTLRPGWSRMVLMLSEPALVRSAELRSDETNGTGVVRITLEPTDPETFTAAAGVPADAVFAAPPAQITPLPSNDTSRLRIVLDPGHGGIDPGAEAEGLREVDLMMTVALELQEALTRTGRVDVILTRDGDYFVPLERRIAIANEAKGDLFISLHADSLATGSAQARGATVYTLSDKASDLASQALAERHDRDDLLSGVDLSGQDDEIALLLMELARRETAPRATRFADQLVANLDEGDLALAGRPRRSAGFSVLKSPDIPSVLLELGFLTSERDRENLTDPEWRKKVADTISQTTLEWADDEAVRGTLIRN